MTISIRDATEDDAEQLVALSYFAHEVHLAARPEHFRTLEPAPVTEWLRALVRRADVRTCLASSGGAFVGYAVAVILERPETPFCFARRLCEIDQIAVAPEFRRQGVARALIEHLAGIARREGIRNVELNSWSFNTGAHRAFEAAGFRPKVVRFERILDEGAGERGEPSEQR